MLALLRMSAGAIVWAVHFGVIYGATAVGCALGTTSLVSWTVGISGAIASAALLAVTTLAGKSAFEHWMTGGVAVVALVAVFWETLAVFAVPPCA